MFPNTIISGGQTGSDIAGLDFAINHSIAYGGFIPKGRLTENGPLNERYQLTELNTKDYPTRTRKNIEHADATLIITPENQIGRGTRLTINECTKQKRPFLTIDPFETDAVGKIYQWLLTTQPHCLNIAGPRESSYYGVYQMTYDLLVDVHNLHHNT